MLNEVHAILWYMESFQNINTVKLYNVIGTKCNDYCCLCLHSREASLVAAAPPTTWLVSGS